MTDDDEPMDDDGGTPDHEYTISSPTSLPSGELKSSKSCKQNSSEPSANQIDQNQYKNEELELYIL